jgi:outer membrane protein assembly factor BamB
VASGIVLLGSESADAETNSPRGDQRGMLTSLDAKSGAVLWSRPIPTWIHSDALIYKGTVYVTCGRWPMVHVGGLLAIDARTGDIRWAAGSAAGMMPGAAIDTVAQTITTSGGDGLVSTYALADGRLLRSTGLGGSNGMSSVRIDESGVAFIGASDLLQSYSTRTGAINWRFRAPGMRALGDITVALTPTTVFTTGTRGVAFSEAFHTLSWSQFTSLMREGAKTQRLRSIRGWFRQQWLIAVDRTTGRMLWRRPLGIGLSVPRNQSGTPVVVQDTVVVSSPVSRTVLAFRLDGKPLWSSRLPAMHKGAATIAGADVILGDKSGNMLLLDMASGAIAGSCRIGGSFSVTAPLLVGKTLIVATRDGAVIAAPYVGIRARMRSKAGGCVPDPAVPGAEVANHLPYLER